MALRLQFVTSTLGRLRKVMTPLGKPKRQIGFENPVDGYDACLTATSFNRLDSLTATYALWV